jgi:Polyferredoxin
MLKNVRLALASLVFILTCLLFVNLGTSVSANLSWLAQIQLAPAILSGSLAVVLGLVLTTLLFGRIYCSVICPLGLLQDLIGRLGRSRRFHFRKNRPWLRFSMLALFVLALVFGLPLVFGLLEPYSAFGRIAADLLAPIWQLANNGLAWLAARSDAFWAVRTDIWIKGLAALTSALLTFMVIGLLAVKSGRLWCNSICPVGTALGLVSRWALFRPRIKVGDCKHCGTCEKVCKASCIDSQKAVIEADRCISCFNCLQVCPKQAVKLAPLRWEGRPVGLAEPDLSRRTLVISALSAVGTLPLLKTGPLLAAEQAIEALGRKQVYQRQIPVLPPGAKDLATFSTHCTGCQLCVSACPNQVLSSRDSGGGLLQPALGFERGYCRPNCVACTQVCPTGAIKPLTLPAKSALQIGRAKVDLDSCILPGGEICTACSRNCPVAAINIVSGQDGRKYPAVNHELCTGCGACEYFCPIRPQAAIRVEGNQEQRKI